MRAQKYAFHFFFRRMVPIACVKEVQGWPPYKVTLNNFNEIKPGKDVGLDVICEGILKGKEFIYPAEKYL